MAHETLIARNALNDNLEHYVDVQKDPVMYNVCVALRAIAGALDDLERKLAQVSKQVAKTGGSTGLGAGKLRSQS